MKQDYDIQNMMYILGSSIRQARKMAGLTMEDVADRTDLCRQTISKAEAGESMQLDIYLTIMKAVDLEWNFDIPDVVRNTSVSDVSPVQGLHGIAPNGISYVVHRNQQGDTAEYVLNGTTHRVSVPDQHIAKPYSSFGKFLYLFSAGDIVRRDSENVQLEDLSKLFEEKKKV